MEEPVYKRVYRNFVQHVTKENVQFNDAFDAIRNLIYVANRFEDLNGEEKKIVIIQTLEDITAGKDGVLYTEDDILPRHVLEGITILIRSNMISSSIDLIYEATAAKAGMSLTCYICRILSLVFCGCCGRKKTTDQYPPLLPSSSRSRS
jgi:hypothetical protein